MRLNEKSLSIAFFKHLQEKEAEVHYGRGRKIGSAVRRVFNPKAHQERKETQQAYALRVDFASNQDLITVFDRLNRSLIETFMNRSIIPLEESFQGHYSSNDFTPVYIRSFKKLRFYKS